MCSKVFCSKIGVILSVSTDLYKSKDPTARATLFSVTILSTNSLFVYRVASGAIPGVHVRNQKSPRNESPLKASLLAWNELCCYTYVLRWSQNFLHRFPFYFPNFLFKFCKADFVSKPNRFWFTFLALSKSFLVFVLRSPSSWLHHGVLRRSANGTRLLEYF